MKFQAIEPFVRQALVGNLDKDNSYDVNTKIKTVDCRLFYIISGSGRMIIEDTAYPIAPGTAVLFSAGTEYVWEIEAVKYYAVNFDYSSSFSHIKRTFHPIHSELFDESQLIERPAFEDMEILNAPIVLGGVPALEQVTSQITTEYFMGGNYGDALLSALLKSAIITMVRISEKENTPKENTASHLVRAVISYINVNYESNVSNEDIAKEFNFNSVYLNRIFKSHTGSSIHEFLINRRITAAMEMLRSQNISVGETAKKCGFGNLYHFSKTFKKRTGMTPSDYISFDG